MTLRTSPVGCFLAIVLSLLLHGPASSSEVVRGKAGVVDGDTIVVDGKKVRLEGIDAPEAGQRCTHKNGRTWRCGLAATKLVIRAIGEREVTCSIVGRDRYNRRLGQCWILERRPSGKWAASDLNAHLIKKGLALAYQKYSVRFAALEELAREDRTNMWSGKFNAPWDHRAERRMRHSKKQTSVGSVLSFLGSGTASAASCKPRYCRQISSRAEACWLLTQCGVKRIDGDGDGAPCERKFGRRAC